MKNNKKKAERLYNIYLKQIESIMGKKETNSNQLLKIGKKMFKNKFVGVFPSDKIPILLPNQYAIVNLDSSKGPQSKYHWVAVIKSNNDKNIYVYDSFGRSTFKILPSLFKSGNGLVKMTENDPEQDLNGKVEANCGQRCLSFLKVYDKYSWSYAKWI